MEEGSLQSDWRGSVAERHQCDTEGSRTQQGSWIGFPQLLLQDPRLSSTTRRLSPRLPVPPSLKPLQQPPSWLPDHVPKPRSLLPNFSTRLSLTIFHGVGQHRFILWMNFSVSLNKYREVTRLC